MATGKKKVYGTYKDLVVEGRGRRISEKRLKAPLNVPATEDEDLCIWLRLAKMLAEAKRAGTWGEKEDEALGWVRELSSADPNFLKGDAAVWTFYERFQTGGVKGRTTLSKKQQAEVKMKYEMGVSMARIAKDHDVSKGTIYRFLENRGLKKTRRRKKEDINNEDKRKEQQSNTTQNSSE